MALGGGTFLVQNKILPGAYINFVSAANASARLSDRGVAAVGLALGQKFSDDIIEITSEDLQKRSQELFGCSYTDGKLIYLREILLNATSVLIYPLDSIGAVKAESELAVAFKAGSAGNSLAVGAVADGDDFIVSTYNNGVKVDEQTVSNMGQLLDNEFVEFKKDAVLVECAVTSLTGGKDGGVDVEAHQKFLSKLENYSYNAICCLSDDEGVKRLYVDFCKRLRDEVGKKFQVVLHGYAADYEGVVNVKNPCEEGLESGLAAWVCGVCAGTAVNRSALNKKYDGECKVYADYDQKELEKSVEAGEFALHRVGSELRVLMDVNSLVTLSDERGEIFRDNQTVRVIDQIGNDIAVLFATKYLGSVPNDAAGRISLWSDIVQHHKQLQDIRAIEDFSDSDVVVEQGASKRSVVVTDAVTVVNAMAKLYMTVTIA